MIEQLKTALKIKTLLPLIAFSGVIMYALSNKILSLGLIKDNDTLALFLFFIIILFFLLIGVAAFYAITKAETDAENKKDNLIRVQDAEDTKIKTQSGTNKIEVLKAKKTDIDTTGDDDVKKKL